jgi:type I restriction enzyme S subunit
MSDRPLRDVLTLVSDPVRLQGDVEYPTAGILSYGRGLFERPVITGAQTRYSTYYRLHQGQFVYSKLFAWEGALAVVDSRFDSLFVSQEFPTFAIDATLATPEYLALLCTWPKTWARVSEGETGMGGRRKRVHPNRLLDVVLPFPPLEEQRRIVDLIGAIDGVARAADAETVAADQVAASHEAGFCLVAETVEQTTLEAIADVAGGITKDKKKEEAGSGFVEVPYLRVANVQRGFLDLSTLTSIKVPPVVAERRRLHHGDVLLTEGGDRDKLGRGWIWEGQVADCVHQNHVFRARIYDERFDPRFVSLWANSFGQQWFFENGGQTTGIASISLSTLKRFPIPRLPLSRQVEVVAMSEAARQAGHKARSVADAARELRAVLLSELLSGAHQIPPAYDVLLELA